MTQAVTAILTAIVIAAISSWITVQLSLRKFRAEKWWEKKVDVYSKVIEALHNSKMFAHYHLEAEYHGSHLLEGQDKELRERAKAANDEILKAIDVGAFIFSDEALARLQKYQKESEEAGNHQSWFEYLEADLAATDSCLKDLIQIAKRDIRSCRQ
jgi:hypothetical protein